MKKLISLVSIILIASNTQALNWSEPANIDNVRVYDGEYIFGELKGVALPCGNSDFRVSSGLRLESAILSILLAAQTSGKQAEILLESGECTSNGSSYIYGARLVN